MVYNPRVSARSEMLMQNGEGLDGIALENRQSDTNTNSIINAEVKN